MDWQMKNEEKEIHITFQPLQPKWGRSKWKEITKETT